MTDILIGTHSRNSWQRPGTTATLRIWFSGEFRDTNGDIIEPGNGSSSFYDSIPCTVNPTTHIVTIPAFTLPSTLDGLPSNVLVYGRLYDASNAPREFLMDGWSLSNLPTSLPFDTWYIFNQGDSLSSLSNTDLNRIWVTTLVASLMGIATQGFIPEIPAGTINGVNATFTLSQTPVTGSLELFLNGQLQREGSLGAGTESYTIAGKVITHNLPPQTGDWLYAVYRTAAVVATSTPVGGSERVVYASELGASLNTNLVSGGGTDDTAIIQIALNLASTGIPLKLVMDGPALVGPLNIYGNTTIECLAGGGFFLRPASNRALLRNANPTIGAITDKNISLIGGTYNGNSVSQSGTGALNTQEANGTLIGLIQMYGVDNLKIHNVKTVHSKTICVHLSNVQNFDIRDLEYENQVVGQFQQGGTQIEGLCSNGTINGLRGSTEDDFLAFSSDGANYPNPPFTGLGPYVAAGAITDITASNFSATSATSAFRLFNGVNRVDRIRVSNVTGKFTRVFSNDFNGMELTGNVGTIEIDGVICSAVTFYLFPLFDIFGKIDRLSIRNVHYDDPPDQRDIVRVNAGANLKLLEIDGLCVYETLAASDGFVPINIQGRVEKLVAGKLKWLRSNTLLMPISATATFIKLGTLVPNVTDLIVDGLVTDRVPYGIYHTGGFLENVALSNVFMKRAAGGAAMRTDGATLLDVSVTGWHGDMAPPFLNFGTTTPRRRGQDAPADTTPPTYTSSALKGNTDIVTVTFSEDVNGANFSSGVTIKKNTVAQTILAASRTRGFFNKVDYQLSAVAAPGDAVTWEYLAASGFITDWSGNALANVTAQAVTNANTVRIFDRFTAADGTALNARAPSPTSGGAWATLRGTAGLQAILSNMGKLDAPFLASGAVDVINSGVQSLIAESGQTDVTITCDVRLTDVIGGAGIVFRATDINNFWVYWLTPLDSQMFKVVAGVATAIAPVLRPHGLDIFYRLRVVTAGNVISGFVNDGEANGTTDAFNNAATKHGIHASQGPGYFDNFMVVS